MGMASGHRQNELRDENFENWSNGKELGASYATLKNTNGTGIKSRDHQLR